MDFTRSKAIDNLQAKPQVNTLSPIDINFNIRDKGIHKDHFLL